MTTHYACFSFFDLGIYQYQILPVSSFDNLYFCKNFIDFFHVYLSVFGNVYFTKSKFQWFIFNIMFICVSVSGIVYFAERKLITGGTRKNQTAQMTGGLVQEFEHEVLPSIKPIHTMVLSVVLMLVSKTKIF